MYAAAANGGYVTYVSALRQQVTLHGAAQITGTRGLGTDLLLGLEQTPDPLARPIPPATLAERGCGGSTSCPARGRRGEIVTFDCSFEPPASRRR